MPSRAECDCLRSPDFTACSFTALAPVFFYPIALTTMQWYYMGCDPMPNGTGLTLACYFQRF